MTSSSEIQFPLRDAVQRAGMLTLARNVRAAYRREISKWVEKGCPSPAPNVVKMAVVRHNVMASKAKYFVETGTYLGSMVQHIASTGVQCISIEIDQKIYERAQRILAPLANINLHLGDSALVLPEVLKNIDSPAVFWLDGHYSGGFTGKSSIDTPVSAELQMILDHPIKQHVILIDDARDFNGEDGYPLLSHLISQFDYHPHYRAHVSTDIIRITSR
jgi:hypothetical protein